MFDYCNTYGFNVACDPVLMKADAKMELYDCRNDA